MNNRVFIPQIALDQGIVDGTLELVDGVLTVVGEGRRYQVEEAVHVQREVSGGPDTGGYVGRVKTRVWLEQQGAEIVETSMLVGDAAYDVEPGWVGLPVGSFADFRNSKAAVKASTAPKTEEELLTRSLTGRP